MNVNVYLMWLPVNVQNFLMRTTRQVAISKVDRATSNALALRKERKQKVLRREKKPPMTQHVSPDELQQYIKKTAVSSLQIKFVDFPRFPCHTQAVKIKLATDPSQPVYGPEAREKFIKSGIALQKSMPKFKTKEHFT
ncbi:hypothetical protein ILUMI_08699, partial [Ignelater luminosus]